MDDQVTISLPPKMYLNQSRYKGFQDCERYYGWQEIEHLVPAKPRKPLTMGTAVHRAQVEVYKGGASPEVIATATEHAVKFWSDTMAPSGPTIALAGMEGLETKEQKELQEGASLLRRMLPAYYKFWGEQGAIWRPLGMELEFCVEVGEGTNVFLVGTIDNLAMYLNALWLVDTKTMHKMDMREFLKYQIDIQLTAYLYGGTKQLAIQAAAEGKKVVPIRGAIIDGMVKTDPPQFHRELYTRTYQDLAEFEQEFCFKAWDIASRHALVRRDRVAYNLYKEKMFDLGSSNWKVAFPKATNHCFRYGECSHRTLCVQDNETRRLDFVTKARDYVDVRAAQG